MSRAPAALRRSIPSTPAVAPKKAAGYFEHSSLPLTSLIFLAPLIIVYEMGTRWYAIDPVSHVEQRIIAFNMIQKFFALFGANGKYLPAAAVASILLGCHAANRDGWSARLSVLSAMLVECVMYAVPLVGLGYLFEHCLLLHSLAGNWREWLVLSIGAGIYEELVFRLAMFSLLSFVLIDLLQMPKSKGLPVMVVISAISFSLYHYQLPYLNYSGSEPFAWPSFIFRSLAGIYFGMIFLWRGFGLTAGAHTAYDVTVVLLRLVQPA